MSFIDLYNRADEAVQLLNDYEGGDLAALLAAYKAGELTPPPADGGGGGGTGTGDDGLTDEQRGRLDEILDRAERAVNSVEFPPRRLGPGPIGEYHKADGWGVHFATNRTLHLGRATVDAESAGTFTATLAAYDGQNQFDPVQSREIKVSSGKQRVNLDFTVPKAGEYILVREGELPLRRGQWPGWGQSSRDGLLLHGGSKAGDFTKPNDYWYYFFDLSVAVEKGVHLPEPTSP